MRRNYSIFPVNLPVNIRADLYKAYLPYLLPCWKRWRGLHQEHCLFWWKATSRSPWSNCCCWIVDTSEVQPGFQQWSLSATNTKDFISGDHCSGNIMMIPETASHLLPGGTKISTQSSVSAHFNRVFCLSCSYRRASVLLQVDTTGGAHETSGQKSLITVEDIRISLELPVS